MATSLRKIPGGPDSTTIKFLFAVIKQLETKSVNWQMVADDMGITNGHAARMRFSRLKAQVEGNAPYGKTGKPPGEATVRKQRKTDIRTERKREAERLAAEQATTGQINDTGSAMKTAYDDPDAQSHADDEHGFTGGYDGGSDQPLIETRIKMEPGLDTDLMRI